MCGIAGIAHSEAGASISIWSGRCARGSRGAARTGGFYFDDWVGLGMRRLAIIDVQTGQRPIANETQSVKVVFNGELYNYQALRRDLESRNHRFTIVGYRVPGAPAEDFGDEP
jgi:asparagine synthase (glutamine-hydrolysing)